ncbi:FAD-dependent monooxygenase [Aquabacterium sp.]|uniref:FAD-dependent monooxygenase n=1 Tax=Aquabacterium sp. TaxID=1872578 RepID=UPI002C37DFF0|nr:FAD-dependent monooxygenase [Aquabacterium sp.]HSW05322.1 FAD-dependent monooxygenase [Aquabacterium sp.]
MTSLDARALAALCLDDAAAAAPVGPRCRAVVIGASLAGLLAARVLSAHHDEVLLLERGELPDEALGPRKATPHTRHTHALLARGREVIEQLLPGIGDEWLAAGALLGDVGSQAAFYAGRKRFAQRRADAMAVCLGRAAIEGVVRRRVLALPQVRVVTGVEVHGLVADARGECVQGLRWRAAHSEDGSAAGVLRAALVVDASGRGSRLPRWLTELGCSAPDEEQVQCDIRYATAYLARQPHHAPGLEAVIGAATADHPQPSVLLAQEGRRWVVTLGGYGNDAPPLDRAGFIARAQRMSPELAAVVRDAEFLCEPFGYRFPHSQRRYYERLRRLPDGVLAIGDSICSFNPVFGQGMSVAACEALALHDALLQGREGLARRYFRGAARSIDIAWQTAVGADLSIPSVQGERPWPMRLINAYVAKVFDAAQTDATVAVAFQRVSHLLAAPPSLMRPGLMWRVFTARRRQGPAALVADAQVA